MFAAFLGGWEIVLIIAVVLMMGVGILIGIGALVVLLYRQQKKVAPPVSTQQQMGQ
jgi:hypothetical protein